MKSASSGRREFLKVAGGAAAMSMSGLPGQAGPAAVDGTPTIQQVIDLIISKCSTRPIARTVDTVKTGDPAQKVKAIATTFLATREVIERAVQAGANFIIAHEPTFYNHLDNVSWLEKDPVYAAKRKVIDQGGIVIWRFHDYWHMHQPDGVMTGFLKQLGWEQYAQGKRRDLCVIPVVSLEGLAGTLKQKLGIAKVQVVGDGRMECRNVAFSLGAAGGETQIRQLSDPGTEVLVVGEINEWETSEYVRDAVRSGMKKGLIILGHANSEEAGMSYLVEWLRPLVPGVRIIHIPAGDPFRVL
jgi:putative NIF3 family GTP cyclohydrolase 1 type 2